jgi:hypothetical protein
MLRVLPYLMGPLCALFVFMTSCLAYGQEEYEEVIESGAISLAEGEAAPFEGILFPTELAIRMGFTIENLQARLVLDIEREHELCRAQLAFEERRRELEEERRDYQIELLTERVQEQSEQLAQPMPWYRRWGFAYGMGIVSSVILIAGGVAALIAVM